LDYANFGDNPTQEENHQFRNTAEFDSHHNYLGGEPRGNSGTVDDSCVEDIRKFAWPDLWIE